MAKAGLGDKTCVILAGPSGVGKSTMIKMLLKDFPEKFDLCVSHTTRNIRPGEEDGKSYHFVTKEAIEAAIADGKFIEHTTYAGNIYGTSFASVEKIQKDGKICILDIEMAGVQSMKASHLSSSICFIMILPPSGILEERLRGRGDTSEDAMAKRLEIAKVELAMKDRENFWDFFLTNDNKDDAYARLIAFLGLKK